MSQSRRIRVEALTRVEGHGGLNLRVTDGELQSVELDIYEPPRFFEALLRGRPLEDVPDITARICGICPVAYQMSSVHALERALGVEVSPTIRELRRLLYCGEWIESHALHMFMLHAPDFLGLHSGIEMGKRFPHELRRGLRIKKAGNRLLEVLGGRSVHPINVCVGGFFRAPTKAALDELLPELEWGVEAAAAATHWVNDFAFPQFEPDYDLISLTHPTEYPFNEGEMISSRTGAFPVAEYEQNIHEFQAPHSTALHAKHVKTQSAGLFGPIARLSLNADRLHPRAKRVLELCGLPLPCRNPFQSIVARGVELTHAFAEAVDLVRAYQPPANIRHTWGPATGEGAAATEAPRGTLFHRYRINESGEVSEAVIIPPTAQNQMQIENDLRQFLPRYLENDDDTIAHHCERLIRCYDPCISCATHFLRVKIERHETHTR